MIGRYIIGWNDSATEKYRHRKLENLPVYHERQSFWLCAKHSLNNVLQQEAYTHNDLERVANQLHAQQQQAAGWLSRNNHKNTFGFGDYDVNVITGALHERGLDLHWHDNRVPISQAMPTMANPELSQAKQQSRHTSQPPPLPMRHPSQPHKAQETPNPGHASPTTPASLDPQQRPKLTSDSARGCHSPADARPPTSDRVAEFRLDIPDGIRNMTQHAGAQIHGSVLLTVTKATRAQRIQVRFLGQQRSRLQDAGSQSPIASFVTVELPLFDRQLTLWDGDADGAGAGVLEPGTLRLPFTVALPEAEYPATVRREGVCRVKYSLWAELERQSVFCDRVLKTPKEEIWMSPRVYPGGGPSEKPLRIDAEAVPRVESGIVVRVAGAMLQSPVVAGGCVGLHLEATTAVGGGSGVEPGRLLA
ncbi:Josephin-domain-containing protein [Kickxella alabastrina]|uniref:Josephin-domain-containing protein n=1 Tax=Kickxella alabastrina TaxID=61397 RepID=UPI00221E4181|nr:Josephin-domain-containing protein [Kickxella alabastrina]KAI7819879.1 Josephin-domain-containing protein [Kickxella alabastrina]